MLVPDKNVLSETLNIPFIFALPLTFNTFLVVFFLPISKELLIDTF